MACSERDYFMLIRKYNLLYFVIHLNRWEIMLAARYKSNGVDLICFHIDGVSYNHILT